MAEDSFDHRLRRFGKLSALALSVLLLLLPLVLRVMLGSPITPGPASYGQLIEADALWRGNIGYDPIHGSFVVPTPYTLSLSIMRFFGVQWLLPIICAIAFVMALHEVLRRNVKDFSVAIVATLLVVVSPAFLAFGTWHSPVLMASCFAALSMISSGRHRLISSTFLFLAAITSPIIGVAVAVMLGVRHLIRGAHRRALISLFVVLLAYAWHWSWARAPPSIPFGSIDASAFFEFGNQSGLSAFAVIIAALGIGSKGIKRRLAASISLSCAVLSSMIFTDLALLSSVFLSVLGAYAIVELWIVEWDLDLLRQCALIVIGSMLLFTVIVSVQERVQDEPSGSFFQAMIELTYQHRPGAVLSSPEYSSAIEYMSGRRAMLLEDGDPAIAEGILHGRDPARLYDALERSGASFILITDRMREDEFEGEGDGLLFILRNTQRFVPIARNDGYEIWYYVPRRLSAS